MSLGSIYIVCPGPSMRDFPFEKLRNRKTIVVNRSCYYVPNWDIMVFLDEGMLNELSNSDNIDCSKDAKIYTRNYYDLYPDKINLNGLDIPIIKPETTRKKYQSVMLHRSNSGFFAFSLAAHLGYRDIRILGMDSTNNYFLSDSIHGKSSHNVSKYLNRTMKHFDNMYKGLNVSRYDNGNWNLFSKKSISEILRP
jgi:hypothetical protein